MIRRTALLGMVLALTVATAESQPRFDIAIGPQFGLQDRETPVSRGWIVSTGFEIDGQEFVVEGSWHRSGSAHERYFGYSEDPRDSIGLELRSGRILTLAAGVRSPKSDRPIAPFYQVLAGGAQFVWRTDYEYPASIDVDAENANCGILHDGVLVAPCINLPYPEFDEERNQGFVLQTGAGLEVRIRREIAVRVAADLLFLATREYVGGISRISARVVIGF